MTVELSPRAAQTLMLAVMGLDRAPKKRATKASTLGAIRQMEVLQIDTIHVVARSPYLVLWSRLGDYEPRWLEQLLAERALFETWSHEACFVPIEEYPLYRRLMLDAKKGWKSSPGWIESNRQQVDAMVAYIREHGPVRSADFTRTDGRKGTWWDWKPEKLTLEHMHSTGMLMIAARENFHRVYDLRERVLPDWDDARTPDYATVQRTLALKAVRALGIATPRWAADYFRTPKTEAAPLLDRLAADGEVLRVSIDGIKDPAYVHPDHQTVLKAAGKGKLEPTLTTLLSPFDPLVWDRARASALFGFDYRIECYTPAPKRRYGYFTLPILNRGRLVGRLDPKAHRADGVFEVKAVHLEPGVKATAQLVDDLAETLVRIAVWHKTPRIVVRASDPAPLARKLTAAIARREGLSTNHP